MKNLQVESAQQAGGQTGYVEGFENVSDGDAPAYLTNYSAHKKGISFDETIKVYDNWARTYDEDISCGRYNGPAITAEVIAKYYEKDEVATLEILDVAAGTGRVGEELYSHGFRLIDGLEPSDGMMEILEKRNIYKKTFQIPIGYGQIQEIKTNTYDCLAISGGMGEGHIPVNAIDEMIRVVKPGGIIVIVMREEYLSYVDQYVGKLEPYMKYLEETGCWTQVGRKVVQNYSFKKPGVIFVYEVACPSKTK